MSNSVNKIRLIKSIENGKGIQHLLNEAYKVVENPMLICDMAYKPIVYTEGVVTIDPFWNEIIQNYELSASSIKIQKNEGFLEDFANSNGKATLLESKALVCERIYKFLDGRHGILVGSLWVLALNKRFEETDIMLIDVLGDIISNEISNDEHYLKYGQAYQDGLVRDLIDRDKKNKWFYSVHVANLDRGLKDNIYLAVADISQCNHTHTKLQYFRDMFKQERPSFKYTIYGNYIIILMSTNSATFYSKRILGKLYMLFEQYNIHVGISTGFDNLFELSKHYAGAVEALNRGLTSNSHERIYLYDKIAHDFQE